MNGKRILFMGTGDIAIPSFKALLESDYDVVGLVTQPDKPVGRKMVLTAPAIKVVAEEAGVDVVQPESVRDAGALDLISGFDADLMVVMAYGQILPKALIAMPRVAIINLHASLLPKYRGASCIQGAIDAGDSESGMTVMHVVSKLDAGDVILRHAVPVDDSMTGGVLHDVLAEMGPSALLEALGGLFDGTAEREVQDDAASSYVPKLMRQDGEIDWSVSAEVLERRIRAYDPWPGTSTCFKDGKGRDKRLKVFAQTEVLADVSGEPGVLVETEDGLVVACGVGGLRLEEVQAEGSRRMSFSDFLKGHRMEAGSRFFCLASGGKSS